MYGLVLILRTLLIIKNFESSRLQHNVPQCWHFKPILIKRKRLHFGRFSLGPPFAKSRKLRNLGVLAKFVITRLCGHFWSRRMLQNALRCWHFKGILIRRVVFIWVWKNHDQIYSPATILNEAQLKQNTCIGNRNADDSGCLNGWSH